MADVIRDGLDPQRQESTTSKESLTAPQAPSTAAQAADEGSSPRSSPKRKSQQGLDPDGKAPQRRKTDRKPTWKTKFLNSWKRKAKRKDSVAASSRNSVDIEASDFSFHQPPRVSQATGKRGSPSLELHSGKTTFKRRPHSFLDLEVRPD